MTEISGDVKETNSDDQRTALVGQTLQGSRYIVPLGLAVPIWLLIPFLIVLDGIVFLSCRKHLFFDLSNYYDFLKYVGASVAAMGAFVGIIVDFSKDNRPGWKAWGSTLRYMGTFVGLYALWLISMTSDGAQNALRCLSP